MRSAEMQAKCTLRKVAAVGRALKRRLESNTTAAAMGL